MLRKLAIFGAAVALPFSMVAANATSAHAGGTLDASHYTVSCDTMLKGSVGFAPPLSLAGVATSDAIKIKGTVTGCTATPDGSNPAVTVLSGTVAGALTSGSNNCTSLLGPSSAHGTITIKWKTVPALLNASTVITVGSTSVGGGLNGPFADTAQYGQFSVSSTTQTGAFGGPSGTGAASFTKAITVEGFNYLGAACAGSAGMKAVTLGSTELFLG